MLGEIVSSTRSHARTFALRALAKVSVHALAFVDARIARPGHPEVGLLQSAVERGDEDSIIIDIVGFKKLQTNAREAAVLGARLLWAAVQDVAYRAHFSQDGDA